MKNLFRQLPYYRHWGKVSFSRSPHDPTLCLINLLKALRSIARYRCPMRPMCPGCFYSSQIFDIENSVQGEKVGHPRHVGHVTECYRADQSADRIGRDSPESGMIRVSTHLFVRCGAGRTYSRHQSESESTRPQVRTTDLRRARQTERSHQART